jgi:hypothetical protein
MVQAMSLFNQLLQHFPSLEFAALVKKHSVPRQATEQTLAAAEKKPFDAIRQAHIKEHQRLFRRVQLDLGTTPAAKKPTDERIRDFANVWRAVNRKCMPRRR